MDNLVPVEYDREYLCASFPLCLKLLLLRIMYLSSSLPISLLMYKGTNVSMEQTALQTWHVHLALGSTVEG